MQTHRSWIRFMEFWLEGRALRLHADAGIRPAPRAVSRPATRRGKAPVREGVPAPRLQPA